MDVRNRSSKTALDVVRNDGLKRFLESENYESSGLPHAYTYTHIHTLTPVPLYVSRMHLRREA